MPGLRRDGFATRTDSDLAQLALIRAGAGIGFCQVALARRSRDLVRVLPRAFSLALDTWLTMHADLPTARAAASSSRRWSRGCTSTRPDRRRPLAATQGRVCMGPAEGAFGRQVQPHAALRAAEAGQHAHGAGP